MADPAEKITELLADFSKGNRGALDALVPAVYEELRRIARRCLGGRGNQTLQPTVLVNEAFLKLAGGKPVPWQNRAHFFAVAAKAMRQILLNHVKAKGRLKRGGKAIHVVFDENLHAAPDASADLLILDEALQRLAKSDPKLARVVELRYFGGLTIEETAEVMGSSPATVKREWAFARAWLLNELQKHKDAQP